jgi:paraquat-inducible protein A
MNPTGSIKNTTTVDDNDDDSSTQTIVCLDCDLLVSVPLKTEPGELLCPRCGSLLLSYHADALNRLISYVISALIFLLLSLSFPFMSYSAGGIERTISLVNSGITLFNQDHLFLAGLISTLIILLPVIFLSGLLYVLLPLKFGRQAVHSAVVLKISLMVLPWNMAEVFLLAVLVSIMKLSSNATIELGLSFYAFAALGVLLSAIILLLNVHQIWGWLIAPAYPETGVKGNAMNQQLTGCHSCHDNVPLSKSHCQRCGCATSARKPFSIQRTLAFLSVAIFLYVPANLLPIMQTRILGRDVKNTIVGGIQALWNHGSYPVAIIIFIASIVIPITKMLALGWLSYSVMSHKPDLLHEKTLLYRVTAFVGRWSMLDVFVVAILVSLTYRGNILVVYPGPAVISFAGVVIFTLLAEMNFDPRLLWDQGKHEHRC